MKCFYNTKRKSVYILRQVVDKTHEKTFEMLLRQLKDIFGKDSTQTIRYHDERNSSKTISEALENPV